MLNFCTLFDKNYLPYGLSLWSSLNKIIPNKFRLFILCLDEITYQYFINNSLAGITPVKLSDLEKNDPELLVAKKNRSFVEYYFTLSPCLPLYILQKFKEVDWICSLDADVYFFNDPQPLFDKFRNYSILICPHKFSQELIETGIEKYGIYNVSFQAFKKDETGIRCLEEWRKECIDWCYDYYDEENKRFADQKYLDKWTKNFGENVFELTDHVSGLAPWNLNKYHISHNNKNVLSNNDSLIFYHFHGLKKINNKWFLNAFEEYKVKNTAEISNYIYLPYILELNQWTEKLNIHPDSSKRYEQKRKSKYKRLAQAKSLYKLKSSDKLIYLDSHWLRRIYLFVKKFRFFNG
jgi:hypothetical protein